MTDQSRRRIRPPEVTSDPTAEANGSYTKQMEEIFQILLDLNRLGNLSEIEKAERILKLANMFYYIDFLNDAIFRLSEYLQIDSVRISEEREKGGKIQIVHKLCGKSPNTGF